MLSRRFVTLLIVLVLLANGAASCLFSGRGPVSDALPGGQARWNPVLEGIAEQLTLPIPTAGISDVRDSVVPFFAGVLLLTWAIWMIQPASAGSRVAKPSRRHDESKWERRFLPVSSACILIMAIISAIANHSWEYSWGWIVRTAAGMSIALLIRSLFTRDMVRWSLSGIMAFASTCLIVTLAHRISRGLAYPNWPIGPITITAAMAATWSAIAVIMAICQFSRRGGTSRSIATLGCGVLGLIVLAETGRRSPLAAWVAAMFLASCLYLVRRLNRGQMVFAVVGACLVTVGTGVLYLKQQSKIHEREVSGPVAVRLEYWRHSAELIRARPILGYGPDAFVVHMTNKLAPVRSKSPLLFQSSFDPHCHNEWIQATVEMGLPGGIAYLLLPAGVLFLLARRIVRSGDSKELPEMMACLVGLLVICITESASITLRGPIMPIFYWTLLGLGGALICVRDRNDPANMGRAWAILPAVIAVGFLVASVIDLRGSVREMKMATSDTGVSPRLFGERNLAARIKFASRALSDAIVDPQQAKVTKALDSWRRIYDETPGYAPVHFSLAKSLVLAGHLDEARGVLVDAIRTGFNPYDPKLNLLLAELSPNDPMEQYRCAQRAARGGVPDLPFHEVLLRAVSMPSVKAQFDTDVARARIIAKSPSEELVKDEIVDTLRLSAIVADKNHHTSEGVEDQRLIAELYRRLEKSLSNYRRGFDAEMDAFLQLSLYQFDPLLKYQAAYDAVKEAERYAVLGIPHESLADPQPQYGYVIGEVMPTDFPESLRPLWRFSALLHLIVGDDRFLEYRIFFSLPPQQWTQQNLKVEMAALARQAYDAWTRLPAEQRPKHYARLLEMSRNQ